jgi:hypothetical protein
MYDSGGHRRPFVYTVRKFSEHDPSNKEKLEVVMMMMMMMMMMVPGNDKQ